MSRSPVLPTAKQLNEIEFEDYSRLVTEDYFQKPLSNWTSLSPGVTSSSTERLLNAVGKTAPLACWLQVCRVMTSVLMKSKNALGILSPQLLGYRMSRCFNRLKV